MEFRELKDGESRVILLRHGTSEPDKAALPNDTISKDSYGRMLELGKMVRKAGVIIKQIFMSPRGRAVKTAFAFAEGNVGPEETIAPFKTDSYLTDISSNSPETAAVLKEVAKKHNVPSEKAIFYCDDPNTQQYLLNRINQYFKAIRDAAVKKTDEQEKTVLVCGHGGLLEVAILFLKKPEAQKIFHLGQPKQWLKKEGAVELIFNKNLQLIEENYLN